MRIAYLVNQYPFISHSFIRREIRALEGLGFVVARFSIRVMPEQGEPGGREEAAKTQALLATGAVGLLRALAATALTHPGKFLRALRRAMRLGRRSRRGVLRHLVYLAEACVLLGRLRAAGAEHLHAHFGTNPAAVALLCCDLGVPPYRFTGPRPRQSPHDRAIF